MNKALLISVLAALSILSFTLVKYYKHTGGFLQKNANEKLLEDEWTKWKNQYGKNYGFVEEKLRFSIFSKNYEFTEQHNKEYAEGKHSFFVGMNAFGDLTNEEFKVGHLGLSPKKPTTPRFLVSELPASVDWRDKGAVNAVKNQGSCGSCWAFSAVVALEGLYAVKNGKLLSFSEQQLVDCSNAYGNEGCNGGLMDSAFSYVKDHGITTEDKYAYSGKTQTCSYNEQTENVFKIAGFTDVPANNSAQLMAAIALQPVAVAIEADGLWFQFYFGGVFDHKCGTNLDHGVAAVGYGNQSGKDYYLVRNSWGTWWGEKGYIKLANHKDNTPGLCGIQMQASYPNA